MPYSADNACKAYPSLGAAQESESPPTLSGSLVGSGWSGSRNLDDETGVGVGRFIAKINGRVAELDQTLIARLEDGRVR